MFKSKYKDLVMKAREEETTLRNQKSASLLLESKKEVLNYAPATQTEETMINRETNKKLS